MINDMAVVQQIVERALGLHGKNQMIYVIHTEVKSIFERKVERYISGMGKDAVFQSVSLGWYVLLEGSYEALFLGCEKPSGKSGSKATIRIEIEDE